MDQTLAIAHVLSATTALLAIGGVLVVSRMTRRRCSGLRSHSARRRHRGRWLNGLVTHAAVALGRTLVSPLGGLRANRRYRLVEPALQPFEREIQAHGHRLGHALCLPFGRWVLRCRGCGARVVLREVPALQRGSLDLQIVRGDLDHTGSCPARYLSAPPRGGTQATSPQPFGAPTGDTRRGAGPRADGTLLAFRGRSREGRSW